MPAFTCGACGHPQRGGSRYKVTADNLGGVRALMTASGRVGLAPLLTVGMVLCTISRSVKIAGHPATVPACVSESDQAALKDSLVGRQVSRLLPDAPRNTGAAGTAGDQPPPQQGEEQDQGPPGTMSFYNGTITGVAAGVPGSWKAEFQTPAGPRTMVLSQIDTECCMQSFNSLARLLKKERRRCAENAFKCAQRAEEQAAREIEKVRARAARVEERVRAEVREVRLGEMMDTGSNRQMSWANTLDEEWWTTWGNKVSPTLHSSMFGFATPSGMRDFFEVFFDEEAKLPNKNGISPYEGYALALWRMRRGDTVQHLAAFTGYHRGRLGPHISEWIYRLGAVGRMFVGVPETQYLLDSMPASFTACGMGRVGAIGDATDFMTETIRSPFLKKAKLMQWSDKVHRSAARGTSFCSANGMHIIALALTFGRCSELNCVKACSHWLAQLPSHMHVAYDKGIRGMRSILPNMNFVFMPCFLAPAKGKTQFTVDEAAENRGIARNRYVVEITYKRVKEWHLLKEVVPSEHFHLMNATWFWALGFSNLCHKFLQPPPAAETSEQKTRRLNRARTEAAATADLDDLRDAGAAATTAMEI